MKIMRILIVLCLVIQSVLGLALGADLTGKWESKYDPGTGPETMTVDAQQVGEDIIGSFSVVLDSGGSYSGIVFGRVEGDSVKFFYLNSRARGGSDPLLIITLADGHFVDSNKIEGSFYVQDSDMNGVSAIAFEAKRK